MKVDQLITRHRAERSSTCEDGGVELSSSVLGPSQRDLALAKLAEQEFDVLIIGEALPGREPHSMLHRVDSMLP